MGTTINYVKLKSQNNSIVTYLVISGVVVITMMFFGILMLLSQGGIITLSPAIFYQVLTIHGTGMIGVVALATAAIMWYFLNHYVKNTQNKFNFILIWHHNGYCRCVFL